MNEIEFEDYLRVKVLDIRTREQMEIDRQNKVLRQEQRIDLLPKFENFNLVIMDPITLTISEAFRDIGLQFSRLKSSWVADDEEPRIAFRRTSSVNVDTSTDYQPSVQKDIMFRARIAVEMHFDSSLYLEMTFLKNGTPIPKTSSWEPYYRRIEHPRDPGYVRDLIAKGFSIIISSVPSYLAIGTSN